jgi:phage baseplate assembly protein gpV
MARVAELERRSNNFMRQAKVNDIDEQKGLIRLVWTPNPDQQPVLTGWMPWTEQAGNIRSWKPPSVGEQMILFSPSGEIGLHTWAMRGGFTKKEGELIPTKPFVNDQDTRDEQRSTIEVIEDKNTTGEYGVGGAEPNQSQGQPGPLGYIWSVLTGADREDRVMVKKKQGESNEEQTQPHNECWKKREKGTNVHASFEQHKVTNEDVPGKLLAVTDQSPDKRQTIVQDQGFSSNKLMTAAKSETVNMDGAQANGKTGGKGLLPTLGWLKELWDGASSSGGGQNFFRKTQTAFMNEVQGKIPSAESVRTYLAGKYTRMTEKAGMSKMTTTQDGPNHDQTGDATGKISRKTGKYQNNAASNSNQHAGSKLGINSGGKLGISAGAGLALAAGGQLKLAGHSVKIGGPVKMSKNFLGWGGTVPNGGGSGDVNVDEDFTLEDDPESPPDPDEFDLHERLEAIERAIRKPGDIFMGFDESEQDNCLFCDGQTLEDGASIYPKVAERYPWMVTGGTDLTLPDMNGRFMRVWANGSNRDPDRNSRGDRVGGEGGDLPGTTQEDEVGPHIHDGTGFGGLGGSGGTRAWGVGSLVEQPYQPGAWEGSETRPKNIYVTVQMFMGDAAS